jgi:hypothetical protein
VDRILKTKVNKRDIFDCKKVINGPLCCVTCAELASEVSGIKSSEELEIAIRGDTET